VLAESAAVPLVLGLKVAQAQPRRLSAPIPEAAEVAGVLSVVEVGVQDQVRL
jgi:hypothetical protein